jgi:4-methylaminobutanoate oxidase (formaldehyde-forming)
VDAGYYAIDSLRLEKGYRAWGRELTPDDTPLEAGLGWAVRFDKGSEFLGRQALLERKGQPLAKRLVSLVLDNPELLPWGDEPIWCDGKLAGSVTSAAFGHTLGRGVALGWIRRDEGVGADWLEGARVEMEIAGQRHAARASLRAPYDPDGLRVKA